MLSSCVFTLKYQVFMTIACVYLCVACAVVSSHLRMVSRVSSSGLVMDAGKTVGHMWKKKRFPHILAEGCIINGQDSQMHKMFQLLSRISKQPIKELYSLGS